jgi:hypothetical protein
MTEIVAYQHPKINTFTRRPGVAQIASYIIFTAQVITYYVCLIPEAAEHFNAMIVMHTAYPVSLAVLIGVTLVASLIDPTDPVVIDYMRHRNENSTYGAK